jgi:hypothetical protein
MSAIAYPYLRIDAAEVLASPWSVRDEDWRILSEYLPDWDYASEVRLRRRIQVNISSIAGRFDVPIADLRLRLIVTVGTGGAREDRNRRTYWARDVTVEESDCEVELLLDGLDVAQRFSLRTDLLYAGPVQGGGVLAPKRTGLRLWDEMLRVRVEPEEARFPIEALSFSQHFRESRDALWRLEWSPADLAEEFAGSFRLFINDDFPDFVTKVSTGDITTVRLLMAGVRLQIARGTLSNDGFEDALANGGQISIATAVNRWLSAAFPGEGISAVRQLSIYSPAVFDAAMSGVNEEGGMNA